ncbi:hypothetical protein B0T22DRAFT_509110 [Podospora appendiculata]|uniref:Uncharacterized protein n=1 Tax=Podospora appendiculata TaxID=314037 RepID=A0AAE0XM75_9PEZI|nr:hypothetical protein B0T22DRAFT_509110 [Podospora appendiculata]
MGNNFSACGDLVPYILKLRTHYTTYLLADLGLTRPSKNEAFAYSLPTQVDTYTALIYNNNGVIYDSRNDAAKALEYANYGNALIDAGKYEEAQEYYRRAIEVHERAEPPSSDLLDGVYSCMSKSMLYLGRLDEADKWLTKAIAHHIYPLGLGYNFFVAETLFALGSLRMKQNNCHASEAWLPILTSLDMRMGMLGPNVRLVGVCQHHFGYIYHRDGNKTAAIDPLRLAVAVFRDPSQTQTGLLQHSMSKLAAVLEETGDRDEAARIREEIISISKDDERTGNIEPNDEKAWNAIVQVAYRCV